MIKFSEKKEAIDKAKEVLKIAKQNEKNKKGYVWVTNGKTTIQTKFPEKYINDGFKILKNGSK